MPRKWEVMKIKLSKWGPLSLQGHQNLQAKIHKEDDAKWKKKVIEIFVEKTSSVSLGTYVQKH